jgi:hypothetical protein
MPRRTTSRYECEDESGNWQRSPLAASLEESQYIKGLASGQAGNRFIRSGPVPQVQPTGAHKQKRYPQDGDYPHPAVGG